MWRSLSQSLLHGDTHRGNLGFHHHGVTLFDWQVTGQGPALKDLAYFAATSLDTDLRRSIERDLVRDYIDTVRAGWWTRPHRGGGVGSVSVAGGHRLRRSGIYGDLRRAAAERRHRAPALARTVAAVRDHDAFARLRRQFT